MTGRGPTGAACRSCFTNKIAKGNSQKVEFSTAGPAFYDSQTFQNRLTPKKVLTKAQFLAARKNIF